MVKFAPLRVQRKPPITKALVSDLGEEDLGNRQRDFKTDRFVSQKQEAIEKTIKQLAPESPILGVPT